VEGRGVIIAVPQREYETEMRKTELLKVKTIEITTMRKVISRQLRSINTYHGDEIGTLIPLGWAKTEAARGGGPLDKVVLLRTESGEIIWFSDYSCTLTETDKQHRVIWTPTNAPLDQIFIV